MKLTAWHANVPIHLTEEHWACFISSTRSSSSQWDSLLEALHLKSKDSKLDRNCATVKLLGLARLRSPLQLDMYVAPDYMLHDEFKWSHIKTTDFNRLFSIICESVFCVSRHLCKCTCQHVKIIASSIFFSSLFGYPGKAVWHSEHIGKNDKTNSTHLFIEERLWNYSRLQQIC